MAKAGNTRPTKKCVARITLDPLSVTKLAKFEGDKFHREKTSCNSDIIFPCVRFWEVVHF